MAPLAKKYPIEKGRIARGLLEGFTLSEQGTLNTVSEEGRHTMYLRGFDSSQRDCEWGRLAFDAKLEAEMVLIVRVFASNEPKFLRKDVITYFDAFLMDSEEPLLNKQKLFQSAGGISVTGKNDLLLNELSGRYLWISVEILGGGDAELKNFRVYSPQNNFFHTFPEVYRTNGEFFKRYLAIFNTLYLGLQDTIDSLDRFVDIDTTAPGLLPVFAHWLGLDIDGDFLEEAQMRRLLKTAFSLVSMKGTRHAVQGVAEALLGESVAIVEPQLMKNTVSAGRDSEKMLYRDGPYTFMVLLNRNVDEKLHFQLKYIIDQFKPVRSRVNIVFLSQYGCLDSYCCLDVNAVLMQPKSGRLDKGAGLNGLIQLQ